MKRSYFTPILFLGGVVLIAGLYGMRASTIASRIRVERDDRIFKRLERSDDREALLISMQSAREEATSLLCEHMRLHALSTMFIGLVFVTWAFDRRAVYAELQAKNADDKVEPRSKARTQFKSIAFCGLLLLFAVATVLHLRSLIPDWVSYVRLHSNQQKSKRIRLFLEENGIPVKYVNWGTVKGGKTISLEGPEVKDISILSGLRMVSLTLHDTLVTNLRPLEKCPLRRLSLKGSAVSDISPLIGTQISFLDLSETNVSDLQPLIKMPNLGSVRLSRKQISDNLEVLRSLKIIVQEVPGGPSVLTGGIAWKKEYETIDANSVK